jgi:hypothetical protein
MHYGKVLHVKAGAKGVHFIGFCEEQAACPFSLVVFASDLKDVGDVRRLEGRVIEIRGPVKLLRRPCGNNLEPSEPAHRPLSFDSPHAQELRRGKTGPL